VHRQPRHLIIEGGVPALWRAHGTCTTVRPCTGQFTRGTSASWNTWMTPKSSPRHAATTAAVPHEGTLSWIAYASNEGTVAFGCSASEGG
jgi:hypothetical protein